MLLKQKTLLQGFTFILQRFLKFFRGHCPIDCEEVDIGISKYFPRVWAS